MGKNQTPQERRLRGRADALVLLYADREIDQNEMIKLATKWGISRELLLRSSDTLTKERELPYRIFHPDHYEGITRSTYAHPREGEMWCPKSGHYVPIRDENGELNFYESHLKTRNKTSCICKKCHLKYMQKLEHTGRTTRSKEIAERARRKDEENAAA